MIFSKRTIVRLGYCGIIGLLVVSTVTAYRIQDSFSKRSVEIHLRYAHQQDLLTDLRSVLWRAGVTARDYFINPAPDRLTTYRAELRQLEEQGDLLFRSLREYPHAGDNYSALQEMFNDLFTTLRSTSGNGWDDVRQFEFVQQEIVPRRDAAGKVLRQIEKENRVSLTDSHEELADTRKGAADTLVLMLISCLSLATAVALVSLHYSETLEKQTAAQLEDVSKAKLELECLSARLMEIQEEERTRLSRELHDEIVQTLAVIKIEISQAHALSNENHSELREGLLRARLLAERMLRSVRGITLLLRPSLLDDLGLIPALQWLAEDFSRRTRIPCQAGGWELAETLSDAAKTCVYRVAQEALHNCEKHAEATSTEVSLARSGEGLSVSIADNGVGFAVSGNGSAHGGLHFGLIGMRERAASVGGTLAVDSARGKGTCITLWIPMEQADTKTANLQEAGASGDSNPAGRRS